MYLTFAETIEKISSFGQNVFDKTIGFIQSLPSGTAQGLASLLLIILAAIGVLTLFKKSFKVFGTIIGIVIVLIIILSVIGKI